MNRIIKSLRVGLTVSMIVSINGVFAAEPTAEKAKLTMRADKSLEIAQATEAEQLEKARLAAEETQAREQAIIDKTQGSDWEAQQQQKAQSQFSDRDTREQKYLQQAQEAAAQERKIPKPY